MPAKAGTQYRATDRRRKIVTELTRISANFKHTHGLK
jgi:hypothetical protein